MAKNSRFYARLSNGFKMIAVSDARADAIYKTPATYPPDGTIIYLALYRVPDPWLKEGKWRCESGWCPAIWDWARGALGPWEGA